MADIGPNLNLLQRTDSRSNNQHQQTSSSASAVDSSSDTTGTPPHPTASQRHDSFTHTDQATNKDASKEQSFYCTKCDLAFTERRALLRHERESEKHNASNTAFRQHQCAECGKAYKRAHDLRRHLDEVHRAKRRKRGSGPAEEGSSEEQPDQDEGMVPPPGAVPFGNLANDVMDAVGDEEEVGRGQSSFIVPKMEHIDSLTLLKQQNRPARRASHLDLVENLLAQNTKFSKDQEAISMNPDTRVWLENWMRERSVFSVSAFNDRDFAFTSDKYKSIVPTLAPDLKFSHHKIPTAFNHQHMIMAYKQMSAMNPAWNIKVLGAAPVVSLKDKTASVFIQSLVTDDGNVWAEQIIEYKWELYSSKWLCKHVTSMRGQRLLGA